MFTVCGYSNIFKKDEEYLKFKKAFIKNPFDSTIARSVKEAYKCRFAMDYSCLLDKVSPYPKLTHIPQFILDILSSGQYQESVRTIECIFTYFSDSTTWKEYCSSVRKLPDKLKNNANYRFGAYYKKIYKYSQNELKSFKSYNGEFSVDKYRFALLFYNIVTRTFYFSALPSHIIKKVYDECVKEDARFAEYYSYNEHTNQYDRIKSKKKGATFFNETIAWWLVYNRIIHLGLHR